MGVYIGDEKTFIFPSFIDAACEELLDRAKRKFYEPFILFLRNLQGKTAKIKASIGNRESAATQTNGSASGVFLDRRFRRFFGDNGRIFLEQMKKADDAITGFQVFE